MLSSRMLATIAGVVACAPAFAVNEIRVGPFLQDAEPNSVWVVWETTEGGTPQVEFGLTAALGSSVTGTSEASQGTAAIHNARLVGLVGLWGCEEFLRKGSPYSVEFALVPCHTRVPPPTGGVTGILP